MTVADNIAYGLQQHEVTRQDIEYAATEAGANEFISKLPQGYDTLVGEGATALSGGEMPLIFPILGHI
eukprot:19180-Heterococcus_DN1.PRE.1